MCLYVYICTYIQQLGMDYVLGGTGFDSLQGHGILSSPKYPDSLVPTKPPIQWLLVVIRVSMKLTTNLNLVRIKV